MWSIYCIYIDIHIYLYIYISFSSSLFSHYMIAFLTNEMSKKTLFWVADGKINIVVSDIWGVQNRQKHLKTDCVTAVQLGCSIFKVPPNAPVFYRGNSSCKRWDVWCLSVNLQLGRTANDARVKKTKAHSNSLVLSNFCSVAKQQQSEQDKLVTLILEIFCSPDCLISVRPLRSAASSKECSPWIETRLLGPSWPSKCLLH